MRPLTPLLLFSPRSRLAGTSGKAGTVVRSVKKERRDPGFTGSKGSVNHEVEDNEKRWSQNKGRSNVISVCMVRSVNVSQSAYGNMAAFEKGETKVFSLWPDRMSGSGLNLPFHEIKAKTNKN